MSTSGISVTPYNKEILQKDISAMLGGETVPLEIGVDAWDALFRRTLEVFSRYKPNMRHESFTTPTDKFGVTKHDMPDDVIGIHTVEITPGIQPGLNSGLAIESQMLSGVPVYYGVGDTFIDIQYLDLRRRWIKTVSRELGSDPDWASSYDVETLKITLWLFGTGSLFVDATVIVPHKADFTTIPFSSQRWVADWARTEAMLTIGNVRSKFEKIPVAGTMMSLNGNQMIERALAEQARLIEQIQGMRADLFPRWA